MEEKLILEPTATQPVAPIITPVEYIVDEWDNYGDHNIF